ncbi:unnamed protein product [Didymodactylos carnosus]|uniref:DRBM domain-containing protein n=1 Tax=Didymodactylos carnosus TaxID=1234261 RepID=A0A813S7S3_9BILA|nr:unnamed protein product [Didymodactylos carnosus]CAF3576698.1 unnamed protein product [Didymodactylos carnosus]
MPEVIQNLGCSLNSLNISTSNNSSISLSSPPPGDSLSQVKNENTPLLDHTVVKNLLSPPITSSNNGVANDKPITDLAMKTPISFLQEICFRIHSTPNYSVCPSEEHNFSNEPLFLYRVTIDDLIAFGKGSSKKRAKHTAAWSMIEKCYEKLKMINDPLANTIEQYCLMKPLQNNIIDDGASGNPVGQLQELTQKNWIRPPEYEYADQDGSTPNMKTYICRAKVAHYVAEGSGSSKKIAKRLAAHSLLEKLEKLNTDEKKALLNRAEGQGDQEYTQVHQKIRRSRRKGNENNNLDLNARANSFSNGLTRPTRVCEKNSFQMLKNSDLPLIKQLLSDDYRECPNACLMLAHLAKEQNFHYTFIELPTIDSLFQVLLEVCLIPVSVFHGYGTTLDIAKERAAFFSLNYIRCLSRQAQQQPGTSTTTTPIAVQS